VCKWHATYCWKNLSEGYNFALDLTSIKSMKKKSYGLPKSQESQFWEFWDSQLGNPKSKWHLDIALWLITENTIRGKVVASPSSGHGEFCEFVCARGSFVHQKCSNYALTNLLFGLRMSMWMIDLFLTRPSPHFGAPICPFTPEVLRAKEHILTLSSIVFTFGLAFESYKEFGVHHWMGQTIFS